MALKRVRLLFVRSSKRKQDFVSIGCDGVIGSVDEVDFACRFFSLRRVVRLSTCPSHRGYMYVPVLPNLVLFCALGGGRYATWFGGNDDTSTVRVL
jgi:hypothetical protein